MAAPDSTQWGSVYGGKGRLGIYIDISNTDTKTTVTVQVYFWTKYGCTDASNSFYYDAGYGTTAATTKIGSVTVNHSVSSGDGWSTSNQTKIAEYTYTYTRQTWSIPHNVYVKLAGIEYVGAVVYANASYTVPALASYTVSYNANGGSGAPSAQTKWHGQSLTLSSAVPTRTGHTFKNWLSSAQSKAYAPGEAYEYNESATMAAQWEANTYTVAYNANGGSGAPASQTKTYGVTLTLSSTIPTRTNHTFVGWALSASASSPDYEAGGSYTGNAALTLYAVWELAYSEPTIENMTSDRCDADGTADDYGAYVKIAFSWSCDQNLGTNTVAAISIKYKQTTATAWTESTVSASGTSGTVSEIIGGSLSEDSAYSIQVTVTDSRDGTTTTERTVGSVAFPIDFLAGGKGVAFGKPASLENTVEFALDAKFGGAVKIGEKAFLDAVYPVGSIYIGYTDTSPAALFGGEWYRIEGRFLYGCAADGTPGLTGGAQDHQHDWSLVFAPYYGGLVGEANGISAGVYDTDGAMTLATGSWHSNASMARNSGLSAGSTNTTITRQQVTGTTKTGSNMPPYISVAIWRRTA